MIKIISGGQTGADRAALDAALDNDCICGGYCPAGRIAEDGPIDKRYPLIELESSQYRHRTQKNIEASHGTLIIFNGHLSGGTALTEVLADQCLKPCMKIDLSRMSTDLAVMECLSFIFRFKVKILNVAGPRASGCPQIYDYVYTLINDLLCELE